MKILAIDTCTEACSAALKINDETISRFEIAPRKHTELILPMIDELMKEADMIPSQLDGLALTRGPGAFTGVRIAAGIIQGIAFAADLPVAQVSSLAAMAQGQFREHQSDRVIATIDARMKEVYWGMYQQDNGLMIEQVNDGICPADQVPLPSDGHHWVGAGSGWASYAEALQERFAEVVETIHPEVYPHAIDVIALARPIFDAGEMVSAEQVAPVYLRDNVVS